jgi:hypothetical protein
LLFNDCFVNFMFRGSSKFKDFYINRRYWINKIYIAGEFSMPGNLKETIENCSCCGQDLTAADFIADPALELVGLACIDKDPKQSYYFFIHNDPGCGTSLLIDVHKFIPFIKGDISSDTKMNCECSESFCIHLKELKDCERECYLSPFRAFLYYMVDLKTAGLKIRSCE